MDLDSSKVTKDAQPEMKQEVQEPEIVKMTAYTLGQN